MSDSLRSAASIGMAVLFSVSAVACVDISAGEARYIDTVEKRFTVTGTPTVKLGTFDGSLDVRTWERQEVLVVIEKHAADKQSADRMVVDASQDGDLVTVDVREQRDGGFRLTMGSFGTRITVTLPVQARLEANTGDGRVSVRDLAGDVTVHTGDGSISLEHVSGAVNAVSGDGSIEIDGSMSSLTAKSGDGRVRVHASGTGPRGDWDVATGDGSVVLEVPDGFGAELDAATGDGRVKVDGVSFSGDRDDDDRSRRRGRLGNGGPRLSIRTGDGSITVRRADGPTS